MRIDVDSNAGEVARSLRFLFRDQVPFATSLAINQTARGIQAEQRAGMSTALHDSEERTSCRA